MSPLGPVGPVYVETAANISFRVLNTAEQVPVHDDVVGVLLGAFVGALVGPFEGDFVGLFVGAFVGALVGLVVGDFVGLFVGAFVGVLVGFFVGEMQTCAHNGATGLADLSGSPVSAHDVPVNISLMDV